MATKKNPTTKKKAAPKKTKTKNLPTVSRRQIRYRLFMIRQGKDTITDDLKSHIESQFQIGMSWKNFTFLWDVSPNDPLKVIREDQWKDEGGSYDGITGKKYPSAFTHQE